MDTRGRVHACITQQIGKPIVSSQPALAGGRVVDDEPIYEDNLLLDDLFMDSLDRIELAMILEEAFGVHLPEESSEQWAKVGDIVQCVEEAIGTPAR